MISAWISKTYIDIIPFDRIICVKDACVSDRKGIEVVMEERQSIMVHPEEIESFIEAYETYLEVTEAVSLGLVIDDPKKKLARRD